MHEVLVNRLGGLSLPRKSVVRLTDRPDMTLDVYRGRKTTNQQHHVPLKCFKWWTKRNKLQLFARADYSEHWLGRVFVLVNDTVPR